MDELVKYIKELEARVERLERGITLREVEIPSDGKMVVDNRSGAPTTENGRIYYDTAAHKYKGFENGVSKTFTTS